MKARDSARDGRVWVTSQEIVDPVRHHLPTEVTRPRAHAKDEECRMAVSLAAIRRLVVGSQGFAGRFTRAGEDDVEAAIRRLTAVQLDSISTVDRAHRLTISSRVGAFPEEIV